MSSHRTLKGGMPVLQVTCKQCLSSAYVAAGDVHEALTCGCCADEHHHGQAASACPRAHEGPCWTGPQSGPRPGGCTVCRPLMIQGFATITPPAGE